MDWVAPLLTLTAMEIVLGIDNIVFITILTSRLPEHQRAKGRSIGLLLALGMRIILLFSLSWLMSLTQPVFHLTSLGVPASWVENETPHAAAGTSHATTPGGAAAVTATDDAASSAHDAHSAPPELHDMNGISWRDLILLAGGLFLIGKSVTEIHHRIDGAGGHQAAPEAVSFRSALIQIALLDIIFSLDSVITAIGMAKQIWVMVTAVILSIGVMLAAAGSISRFVERHPTLKILALSFLILIGVLLVAEGAGTSVNKGYIYFAMAFSLVVEMINIRVRGASNLAPVARALTTEEG
ncbi:MAG: TerC family protein [Planctomycetaceae bacterium]